MFNFKSIVSVIKTLRLFIDRSAQNRIFHRVIRSGTIGFGASSALKHPGGSCRQNFHCNRDAVNRTKNLSR